jgi:AraC-like DNA-binding protein
VGTDGAVRTAARLGVPPRDEKSAPVFPEAGGHDSVTSRLYAEPAVAGTLEFARLAWLALGRVRAGPHRTVHDPRRWSYSNSAQAHVVLQISGSSVLEQNGRALSLEPGEWALVEADRSYAIVSRVRIERIVIVLARERLALDTKLSLLSARPCSSNSGLGRVLYSAVTCVVDELYEIRATHASALAEQLAGILQAALRDELALGLREDKDVRRQSICRYIDRHLHDPKLSPERIAAALHCTPRTLTRIFSRRGETLMEYIYRHRLEGAHRDLLNPARQGRSLTEIALDWGFSNYSHFCERFRRRFDSSPTAVRRRALQALIRPSVAERR